ncbi:MAG TPA: hypothetical protein VMS86_05740 [Thermoanaerobaculia bacterium]|nr:hypothetical protein [Thermoanaerobaculia bacterium]
MAADEPYLIYLHGRIVEEQGVRPTHPRFGVYEYEAILARLAEGGLQVTSEVRPPNTDPIEYAQTVAGQVQSWIDAGVPPARRYLEGNVEWKKYEAGLRAALSGPGAPGCLRGGAWRVHRASVAARHLTRGCLGAVGLFIQGKHDFAAASERIRATEWPGVSDFEVMRPPREEQMLELFESAALR